MYENLRERLASRRALLVRLARSAMTASVLIALSLSIGIAGYHAFGRLGWIDSIYNASMILGGMGPVDRMDTDGGKLFASGYALFAGVALITSASVLIAPLIHRFMHRFHLEMTEPDERDDAKKP